MNAPALRPTGFPGHPVEGTRALILGLTFKENCPDLRYRQYREMGAGAIRGWLKEGGVVYDVKHVLPKDAVEGRL